MAILPVSNLNFETKNASVVFGQKQPKKQTSSTPSNPLKTMPVPVVLLMTMNPSLINAATNAVANPTVITQKSEAEDFDVPENTYIMAPELQTQNQIAPYGWGILNTVKIRYKKNFTSNGKQYTMLFTNFPYMKPNEIRDIYIIEKGANGSRPDDYINHPPQVRTFVHHDLGPDREYCSIRVCEDVMDANKKPKAFREREIVLDDDTAQQIAYVLLFDGTEGWINKTQINFEENEERFTRDTKVYPR